MTLGTNEKEKVGLFVALLVVMIAYFIVTNLFPGLDIPDAVWPSSAVMPAEQPIDLRLRRELLARVQAVEVPRWQRNLFEFLRTPEIRDMAPKDFVGPKKSPDSGTAPLPPLFPLKYYAYWTPRNDGKRTACFLDGEQILMAREGDILQNRYRVLRVSSTSVVMEDLNLMQQHTLDLASEAPAAI